MSSSPLAAMPTPPPENVSRKPTHSGSADFDIVHHYKHLLVTDPLLTYPIAAIESLIALLSASPPSTISETLSLLETATATLKALVSNPIALSAGTDLFQRYIISTLQAGSTPVANGKVKKTAARGGTEDFKAIRAHLLANSRLFVQRAKEARGRIASVARKFVRDGCTILTSGQSRVLAAVLNAAASAGTRFRVIYVADSHAPFEASKLVSDLRRQEIPAATIPFSGLAVAVQSASLAMVGAESVVENGGIISGMGTCQIGMMMKSVGKPLYVVAESHKFVRAYPLNGEDLGIEQGVLDFRTDSEEMNGSPGEHDEGKEKGGGGVDFTPPELITAIVTEAGVQTPNSVSEELIKIWY